MIFTPEQARSQFPSLTQTIDGLPVVFLDGPGGSQVPNSVLTAMTEYLGYSNSNLGGHFFFKPNNEYCNGYRSIFLRCVIKCAKQ